MQYIEPREVTITTSKFEMTGVIEGTPNSFKYQSTNTYFLYWFPSGEIDSLRLDKKTLKQEQLDIIESCENKLKTLF